VSEPYLGEIRLFPYSFAPRGWADCNGQLLRIDMNQALFSLLGTTYGGDGFTTFALPDLRGRVPVHVGQGAGLSNYDLGQKAGEERHKLEVSELPAHDHDIRGSTKAADTTSPQQAAPARGGAYDTRPVADANRVVMGQTLKRGASAGHNTMQPYLTLRFCIALAGVFPSP
jgi:microcystin-dependent protein